MNSPRNPARRVAPVLLLGLVIAGGILTWKFWNEPVHPIPDVHLDNLHPQVVKAIERAIQGVEEQPRSAETWGSLGMILMAHDQPVPARECYHEAIRLAPTDARWPYLLGYTYDDLDFEVALSYFKKALAMTPNSIPARIRTAMILMRLGQLDECEQVLAEGEKLIPNDPYLLTTSGRLSLLKKDYKTAQSRFLKASEQPGWVPQSALLELVKLAMRSGDIAQATTYQRRLLQLPQVAVMEFPDPVLEQVRSLEGLSKVLAERADFAMARGDIGTAITLYESLVKKRPDLPNAQVNLAQCYAMSGNFPEAIQRYQNILKEFGDQANTWFGLAGAYSQSGNIQSAEKAYQTVLELKPDHKQAWFQLGILYEQQGKPELALSCYQKVIDIDPSMPQAHLAAGILLLQLGRKDEALHDIKRAAELAPDEELPRIYLKQITDSPAPAQPSQP